MKIVYRSEDNGQCHSLDNYVPKDLNLKVGAPVILTVNISDHLVNGLQGQVITLDDDGPTVLFAANKTVKLQKYSFTVFSKNLMKDIGVRRQIPLNLAFGITVHKAQGMTLERLVLDCRHMHTPGQIGVAVGRVKSKKGLRILNFNSKLLKPHSPCVSQFYDNQSQPPLPDLTCCRGYVHMSDTLPIHKSPDEPVLSTQAPVVDEPLLGEPEIPTEFDLDNMLLDDSDILLPTPSQEITVVTSHETMISEISSLPEMICVEDMIRDLMQNSPETDQQKLENEVCSYLHGNLASVKQFATEIWKSEVESFNETLNKKPVLLSDIRHFYTRDFQYFSSDTYLANVHQLFGQKPKRQHSNVAYKLVLKIRETFLKVKVQPIITAEEEKTSKSVGKKYSQSGTGRGVQRYIGGWCVATLKHNTKQSVRRNLYSSSKSAFVARKDMEVAYLDNLVTSVHDLIISTTDPVSLEETTRRQNVSGGLTNITDAAFYFFVNLDKHVRALENKGNVHFHGTNFYLYVVEKILDNTDLFKEWKDLFMGVLLDSTNKTSDAVPEGVVQSESTYPVLCGLLSSSTSEMTDPVAEVSTVSMECGSTVVEDPDTDVINHDNIVKYLHKQICTKFIRMSSGQFRKQFLRELKTEKHEAHRKQIRMKKQKKGEMPNVFNFESIQADKTLDKIASHRRLQAEIEFDQNTLTNKFNKTNLIALCNAYDVKCSQSMTKATLLGALVPNVSTAMNITNPHCLDPLSSMSSKADEIQETEYQSGDPEGKRVTIKERKGSESTEIETTSSSAEPSFIQPSTMSSTAREEQGSKNEQDSLMVGQGKRKGKSKGAKKGKGRAPAKKPKIVEYPCGVCSLEADDDSIGCDKCYTWYHFVCVDLTEDDVAQLTGKNWKCDFCP